MEQRTDEWYRQKAWIPKTVMGVLMGATLIAALATSVKMTMDDAKANRKATIENVLGGSAPENCDTRDLFGATDPETFCDVSGKRYFLEIDGKPVAEYLKGRQ